MYNKKNPKYHEYTTSTTTDHRLLSMGRVGADAYTLYHFYCTQAATQGVVNPYATDLFCRNGLHWGAKRHRRAKKILIEGKIIEEKQPRKEDGKFGKKYTRVHFVSFLPKGSKSTSGSSRKPKASINTVNKNINTNNKNINTEKDFLLEKFLKMYPRTPKNLTKTRKAWKALNPDPALAEKIYQSIEIWKESKQWQNPVYIWNSHTFLAEQKWQEIPPEYSASAFDWKKEININVIEHTKNKKTLEACEFLLKNNKKPLTSWKEINEAISKTKLQLS